VLHVCVLYWHHQHLASGRLVVPVGQGAGRDGYGRIDSRCETRWRMSGVRAVLDFPNSADVGRRAGPGGGETEAQSEDPGQEEAGEG